ncbi:MAG: hypothetical protein PHG89_06675 [Gallionella sp.]|nr:hypothetical protein [Gallionella sp.]
MDSFTPKGVVVGAMLPKHFKEEFPWITKPTSKIKVKAPGTYWLEKAVIHAIFRAPDNEFDDPRTNLLKSIGDMGKDTQVSYIKTTAKHLAEAIIDTPLPSARQEWLNDVNATTKKLTLLLKQEQKKNLPENWNNLFSLVSQVLSHSHVTDDTELTKLVETLKEANLIGGIKGKAHGTVDFVSILDLITHESKALSGKSAIAYYKYPQTFFEEISIDNQLLLAYQRKAIQAITTVNQEHFGKPYDALTAHILTCVFNKSFTKQLVKKIRENLNSKAK